MEEETTLNYWGTFAPIVVAFIAGGFALYQVKSNNITNARLKWLDEMKSRMASFIFKNYCFRISEKPEDNNEAVANLYAMMINLEQNDDYHHKLTILCNVYLDLSSNKVAPEKLTLVQTYLILYSTCIFKIELEKIKRNGLGQLIYFSSDAGQKLISDTQEYFDVAIKEIPELNSALSA